MKDEKDERYMHPDEHRKQGIIIGAIALIAIIGILLIGNGMTGFIISESCCFPPNCAPENICDNARPFLESPTPGELPSTKVMRQDLSLLVGAALTLSALAAVIILLRKAKTKR